MVLVMSNEYSPQFHEFIRRPNSSIISYQRN